MPDLKMQLSPPTIELNDNSDRIDSFLIHTNMAEQAGQSLQNALAGLLAVLNSYGTCSHQDQISQVSGCLDSLLQQHAGTLQALENK